MPFKRRLKLKSHRELQGKAITIPNVNGQDVFISTDKIPCTKSKPKGSVKITHAIDNLHHVTLKDLVNENVQLLKASKELQELDQKEAVQLR